MLEVPTDSDSEIEDLYEGDDDDAEAEVEVEDEAGEPAMTPGDDATEDGDDESDTDESDSEDNEDEDEDDAVLDLRLTEEPEPPPAQPPGSSEHGSSRSPPPPLLPVPSSPNLKPISPAQLRRHGLAFSFTSAPGSYVMEAICAIPHPVPTHALASSACMTHLLTGSDDGYIRNYDVFTAVNGKTFLSAPQRHHASVVEGLMKAGQLRFWWENPAVPLALDEEPALAPVYSLAMHSDALWALAGTDAGYINLFTVRHDPGRLCHVMHGHRGPVSALALDYDEKGYFSAGWDGEATQWDLNTGQKVRTFTAHNAQLTSIAIRPLAPAYAYTDPSKISQDPLHSQPATSKAMGVDNELRVDSNADNLDERPTDSDARSDASFDPLFDDVPDEPVKQQLKVDTNLPLQSDSRPLGHPLTSTKPPKGAPPLLSPTDYSTYSPELLMTAFIDGQVTLWDRRVGTSGKGVGRLWMSDKTPPWCLSACWSADGAHIYAGRRNGTVDCWDARMFGPSGPKCNPRLLRTLRNPTSSGVVSCVVGFPDCRHIACASVDNIRLWNVADGEECGRSRSGVQFKIIPGHHGGHISQMVIDAGSRFLVSASSNRGWHGDSTRTLFVHDIKYVY